MLSPELSPFCLKAGSIRRSSSRRRRSHRTLSEEMTEEAAEDKFDLLDEPIVRHPALLMSLRDCVYPVCDTVLALTPPVCLLAASSVSSAGPPAAGHALLASPQHQERKPDQHLQLVPGAQQLRSRLRG